MNQTPRPDSVRLAMASQAPAIARVQRAWLGSQPLLAELLDVLDAEAMTQAWAAAIVRPPLATYRVLVALDEAGEVVGFSALGPSEDPDAAPTDALVAEFCIDPELVGRGHEDRLMHAAVDTMRADGFTRATWWVCASDDLTRALLTDSGWLADGAHREIGDDQGQVRLKQVRLHTALV